VTGVLATRGCEVLRERPVLLLDDVGGNALSEQLGQPFELSDEQAVVPPSQGTRCSAHSESPRLRRAVHPGGEACSRPGPGRP
jgi:hypothetical protein